MAEATRPSQSIAPLEALSSAEQAALADAIRAQGRPAGAWIGQRYGAAAATVLGAALGLPVRPGTAAVIRAAMTNEWKGAT